MFLTELIQHHLVSLRLSGSFILEVLLVPTGELYRVDKKRQV